jgi:predicted transcriptional regulator
MLMMKIKEWTNFQTKRISQGNGSQAEGGSLASNFSKICDFLIENKKKETEKPSEVTA